MEGADFEVIIPAYNEAGTIAEVIRRVRETCGPSPRITVVDDASEDNTADAVRKLGAELIRHPYRIGNGACVKSGLRKARARIVVLMDADGQHRTQDIPRLLKETDKFDMIIGARDFSGISWRGLANRLYNYLASYVTMFKIEDLTCGFRAVKREEALRFLYLLPNTFSYPSTLTLAFLRTGRTIKYVPISSPARSKGKSKIRPIRDGGQFLLIIIKIATFFSPLRVFLPISLLFFSSGLAYYLYTFVHFHRFTNMSALLFTASIIIFMLGLVSEQIAQLRMDQTENHT